MKNPNLEDVALTSPGQNLELTLAHVGMENVQTQIRWEGTLLPASAHAGVSLIDKSARGIHMSRIFRILNDLAEENLSWSWLSSRVELMLSSQKTLSDQAGLKIDFVLPLLRNALVSEERGWRNYPVSLEVKRRDNHTEGRLKLRILYSSTCPCSASLSRQVLQENFASAFKENSVNAGDVKSWLGKAQWAFPHAQRSEASVELLIDMGQELSIVKMIDLVEAALGTPVQAAVKREDEQEFARLNATNLMFCEDAARKLKAALLKISHLKDFQIEVRHFESLHAHDVVARVSKS
jgi:GTP cyclohydrolase I